MSARFTRNVNVRRLTAPQTLTIEATEAERAEIAEALDLIAIDALVAELTVRPWRGEGVRVEGTVRGTVTQACVVTLEPVAGSVEEVFDARFHPYAPETAPVDIDPDEPDPPERLDGTNLDVGAIALEHFVLGLDPYPRADGVAFEPVSDGEEDAAPPSPFAVLAALKNDRT